MRGDVKADIPNIYFIEISETVHKEFLFFYVGFRIQSRVFFRHVGLKIFDELSFA